MAADDFVLSLGRRSETAHIAALPCVGSHNARPNLRIGEGSAAASAQAGSIPLWRMIGAAAGAVR